jgi:sigma-B regulation protein RsbU (phosphoserine phosphatase)
MANCLLIDGNQISRAEIQRLLNDCGLRVILSEGAEDALKRCRELTPDIVVMAPEGQAMPAKDFVRRIRGSARGKAPAVIFYASSPDAEAIGETILEGAADFISRPIDGDLLRFKLTQAGVLRAA